MGVRTDVLEGYNSGAIVGAFTVAPGVGWRPSRSSLLVNNKRLRRIDDGAEREGRIYPRWISDIKPSEDRLRFFAASVTGNKSVYKRKCIRHGVVAVLVGPTEAASHGIADRI